MVTPIKIIKILPTFQIINTYDAARVKRRTCYLTPVEPELVHIGIVHHYPNESHNIDKTIITYNGSFVRTTMLSEGTAYQHDLAVHNPEGYTHFDITDGKLTNPQQYYFRRDHLGSNVAVWNATRDTTVQRTWYYASGTPMSNSIGQSAQSYKYNGKEFIEIFGYSKYDVIARQYDPIIVRTTTIDPHCENDYSTSPYVWCGNNFVNNIDPTGMDWYSDSCGNVAWFDGNENREGFTNIGVEYIQDIGNGISLTYSQNTLTSISYQTMSTTDFIAQTGKTGCKVACDMMLKEKGLNSNGQRVNMAIANDNGVVVGSSSTAQIGFLAVTSALERGMPIEVGVDYKAVQVNNIPPNGDGMTDHFVLITGLTENISDTRVISCRYNFFDPRTTNTPNGTASSNYLMWDGSLFRGYFLSNTSTAIPYVVTTIRCSR